MPQKQIEAFWKNRTFETLVENASDVISRFDRDLRHLYVNSAVTKSTGRPASEFFGKTHEELGMPADLTAFWREALLRVFAKGEEESIEFSIEGPEGQITWFRSRLVPELDATGDIDSVLVIARDVTAVRQAEEARIDRERREATASMLEELKAAYAQVQRSESRLRRLVEADIIGVVMANEQEIYEANDAFLGIIGYTREELAAGLIRWREMTPPEYLPLDEAAIESMRRTGACAPFEKEYLRKDGSRAAILIGASVLAQEPLEWVCFVLDITERKRVESENVSLLAEEKRLRAQAEEAARTKDRLLASVSHELRSPLTSISGWLQILEHEYDDEQLRSTAFRSLRAAVQRQKRMIDDLLDTVRLSRGELTISKSPVALGALAEEILASLEPLAAEAEVAMTAEVTEGLTVMGDRPRLAQVLVNLLSNSLKFTQPGGRVLVRAWPENGRGVLEVTDTGTGIAADFLPHVFDRFTQGAPRSGQGLGLGLAIVRDIVERHGGSVEAFSEGPGRGAKFVVRLPIAD